MATWEQVRRNPTLYPEALLPGEGEGFRWHRHADQPHSSQVFCVSAFGTLRRLPVAVRDHVVGRLLGHGRPGDASTTRAKTGRSTE
jgi:hypothetical protein